MGLERLCKAAGTAALAGAMFVSMGSSSANASKICQKKGGVYVNSSGSSSKHWMKEAEINGKKVVMFDSCLYAALDAAQYREFGTRRKLHPSFEHLIWSMVYVESGFNPNAVGSSGEACQGQFMAETAKKYSINRADIVDCFAGMIRYVLETNKKLVPGCDYRGSSLITVQSVGYNAGQGYIPRDSCQIGANIPPGAIRHAQKVNEAWDYTFMPKAMLSQGIQHR